MYYTCSNFNPLWKKIVFVLFNFRHILSLKGKKIISINYTYDLWMFIASNHDPQINKIVNSLRK